MTYAVKILTTDGHDLWTRTRSSRGSLAAKAVWRDIRQEKPITSSDTRPLTSEGTFDGVEAIYNVDHVIGVAAFPVSSG